MWSRAALSPPRAHGAPLAAARIKAEPEDFRVEEELSFVPSGEGPHRLLRVEKRSANTRWVAAELARLAEVPVAEVGYAGLKDRHAVGVQWFSLPAARGSAEFWSTVHKDEFRVLESHLNARKLRRGALRGLGREISRAFMVRVVLAALTDGFLTETRGAARRLARTARTAFFFFITDPLYIRGILRPAPWLAPPSAPEAALPKDAHASDTPPGRHAHCN